MNSCNYLQEFIILWRITIYVLAEGKNNINCINLLSIGSAFAKIGSAFAKISKIIKKITAKVVNNLLKSSKIDKSPKFLTKMSKIVSKWPELSYDSFVFQFSTIFANIFIHCLTILCIVNIRQFPSSLANDHFV